MNKIVVAAGVALLSACLTTGSFAQENKVIGDVPAASASCGVLTAESYGQPAEMREKIRAYQELVEEALTLRARAIDFLDELKAREERGEILSGAELQRLNDGAARLISQRQALLDIAVQHECWLGQAIPADAQAARLQAAGIAMSLSAALVLYDNYLSAVGMYNTNPILRQHINRGDKGFAIPAGELHKTTLSFNSAINRARVRRALDWMEVNGAILKDKPSDEERYLLALLEQSPSVHMVRQAHPVGYVGNMLAFFTVFSVDSLNRLKDEGVNLSSMLFGNAVGLVETRRGKLDNRPDVQEAIGGKLRAGDVLLEKTPFRLTDTFIPGHWGHVAVWVGSEDELRRLGIWDNAVVKPYQQAIRDGHSVVEALRSGVKMNTLAHFLNVDDTAVLRHGTISDERRAQVILQTLRQVGKAYDFNFDVESTDRIVCSELVYHAYGDIQWPVARHLGRATISPDNVAVEATGAGPFNVIALYHDGEPVTDDLRGHMTTLVQRDVVKMARGE
jgi:uncharacterized protein YycO